MCVRFCYIIFFFKQKTAYEMRISDWSSDVCSSDLSSHFGCNRRGCGDRREASEMGRTPGDRRGEKNRSRRQPRRHSGPLQRADREMARSEEHTTELQSLMRTTYAVLCLKKKNKAKLAARPPPTIR